MFPASQNSSASVNGPGTSPSSRSNRSSSRSNGRQKLAQWLESKLDSQQFPGVQWVDRSQGTFHIPWKHHRRGDWDMSDGLIYKEWAIHRGRFTEGQGVPDWNSFKVNFRCALNKSKNIQELKNLDNDDYRFFRLDLQPGSTSPPPAPNDSSANPPGGSVEVPSPFSHQLSACQPSDGNIPAFIGQLPTPTESLSTEVLELSSDLQQISLEDDMKKLVIPGVETISFDSNINGPESVEMESLKDSLKDCNQQQPNQPQYAIDPKMMLILRYLRDVVLKETIECSEGCRVFYGPLMPPHQWNLQVFGSYDAAQLCIPNTPVELQCGERERILLNALKLGISICMFDGNIYILRRCIASVYFKVAHWAGKQPVKVRRDSLPVKIFDFWGDFLPAFQLYEQNKGPAPSPLTVISFGQSFCADSEEPYDKLFLSLTVCHAHAHQMLTKHMPKNTTAEGSASKDFKMESMSMDSYSL